LESIEGSAPESFSIKEEYCLNGKTLKNYMSKMSIESDQSQKIDNLSLSELDSTV
jgi:hypothetical protein